jgi:hypothetical protein
MESDIHEPLILHRPSDDAVRLANSIYYTYIQEDDPYLSIPVSRLYEIVKIEDESEARLYILKLFDELNEPVAARNFVYGGREIKWRVLHFFDLEKKWEEGDRYIELHINEMFLEAMKQLDPEPYINLRR